MARETSFSDEDRDEDDIDLDEETREEEEEDHDDDRRRGSRPRDRGDDANEEEEEEEEDEEEEEEEEDEEDEEDDEDLEALERIVGGSRGGMVPYQRVAELADKNQKLTEALLSHLAAGTEKSSGAKEDKPPVDIKALRKKHTEAILEGKDDEAADLAEQIDEANIAKAEERALARFREDQQRREQETYLKSIQAASDQILRRYPSLNHFETDPDAAEDMERIIVERDLLIRRGVHGAKAMRQAADKVMGGSERRGPTERDIRRRGERDSIRERAKTAARIPPRTGGNGVGQRGRQLREPSGFSARQVAQMSEQEKRRARGDFDV